MKKIENLEQHYLKMLRGEKPMKSSFARIILLAKQGSCTVCSLPHYRFQVLQSVAYSLKKMGWLEICGKTDTSTNYKMTEKLNKILT